MSILTLKNLTLRFGGLTAVNDVSFSVERGMTSALIGPNGAGKTSVFNLITGVYEPTEGNVTLEGVPLQDSLTIRSALSMIAIALCTGLGLVLALNIQEIWNASIISHYVYRQPFPWGVASKSFAQTLLNLPSTWGLIPLLIGATIGGLGALAVWQRSRRTPDVVLERGVARTFQNVRLFPQMSVLENVLIGMHTAGRSGLCSSALRLPRFWIERESAIFKAYEILDFVGLKEECRLPATSLPYGFQRRLEIARALASSPKVLLLDEPAAGMNPTESQELMELIRKIRDQGVTVLLIEHHMKVVMGVSDRIVVLDYGNKIAEGTPSEIRANKKVIDAYLGTESEA